MGDEHPGRQTKTSRRPKKRDRDIRVPAFSRGKMHPADTLKNNIDRPAARCPDDVHYQDRKREMIPNGVAKTFAKLGQKRFAPPQNPRVPASLRTRVVFHRLRVLFPRRRFWNEPNRISGNQKRYRINNKRNLITKNSRRPTAQGRANRHQQKPGRKKQCRTREQSFFARQIWCRRVFCSVKKSSECMEQNRRQIRDPEIFRTRYKQKRKCENRAQ